MSSYVNVNFNKLNTDKEGIVKILRNKRCKFG